MCVHTIGGVMLIKLLDFGPQILQYRYSSVIRRVLFHFIDYPPRGSLPTNSTRYGGGSSQEVFIERGSMSGAPSILGVGPDPRPRWLRIDFESSGDRA